LGHTPDGLTAYDAPPADDGGGGGDGDDDDDAKRSFARDRSAATRLIVFRYARFRRRGVRYHHIIILFCVIIAIRQVRRGVERQAARLLFVGKRRGV